MVAHPTPIIPALWCRRQDDSRSSQLYNEFQASLGYKQTCLKPTKTWRGNRFRIICGRDWQEETAFPSLPPSWSHGTHTIALFLVLILEFIKGKERHWSGFFLSSQPQTFPWPPWTHPLGFCLAPPPRPHEYSHLTLVDLHGFRSLCGPSLDRAFPSWCFYLFCWVWFGSLKAVSSSGPPTSATQTPGFQVCTTMSRPNREPLQAACGEGWAYKATLGRILLGRCRYPADGRINTNCRERRGYLIPYTFLHQFPNCLNVLFWSLYFDFWSLIVVVSIFFLIPEVIEPESSAC